MPAPTPSTTGSPRPTRRHWLQFSLRTMLLLMVPIACLTAWLSSEYRRGQRQKDAIAWVEDMGGNIIYAPPEAPRDWRREWLPGFYPDRVTSLDFQLPAPPFSRRNDRVTQIRPLADLPDLQSLSLTDTNVIDLTPLAGLHQLEFLTLHGTLVTDLSPLAGHPSLRTLCLDHTAISDLRPLAQVPQLEKLMLSNTPVRDITPLTSLDHLRNLRLNGSLVDDISPLQHISSLRSLGLRALGGRITFQEVQELQQFLPECHIDFELVPLPEGAPNPLPHEVLGLPRGEAVLPPTSRQ